MFTHSIAVLEEDPVASSISLHHQIKRVGAVKVARLKRNHATFNCYCSNTSYCITNPVTRRLVKVVEDVFGPVGALQQFGVVLRQAVDVP